jgi:hypothetical protein
VLVVCFTCCLQDACRDNPGFINLEAALSTLCSNSTADKPPTLLVVCLMLHAGCLQGQLWLHQPEGRPYLPYAATQRADKPLLLPVVCFICCLQDACRDNPGFIYLEASSSLQLNSCQAANFAGCVLDVACRTLAGTTLASST